jgi:hypothetical protein
MLPKWNATISHNFYSSSEQPSSAHNNNNNNNIIHHQQPPSPFNQQPCPSSVPPRASPTVANSMLTYSGNFTGLMVVLLTSRIVQALFFLGNSMVRSRYLKCLQGWLMANCY